MSHLGSKRQFAPVMIVSGDCESEMRYLAESMGITEPKELLKDAEVSKRGRYERPPLRKRIAGQSC